VKFDWRWNGFIGLFDLILLFVRRKGRKVISMGGGSFGGVDILSAASSFYENNIKLFHDDLSDEIRVWRWWLL
jgi:hypothetical protein